MSMVTTPIPIGRLLLIPPPKREGRSSRTPRLGIGIALAKPVIEIILITITLGSRDDHAVRLDVFPLTSDRSCRGVIPDVHIPR